MCTLRGVCCGFKVAVALATTAVAQDACNDCSATNHNAGCEWPFVGGTPDPDFGKQWYIEAIRACEAWNEGYSGEGVVVGVLDWGVWSGHEDIENQFSVVCSETPPDPPPPCPSAGVHGTYMAGVAAAEANNDIGIAGAAFGATVGEVYIYNTPWPDSLYAEMEHAIGFNNNCFDIKTIAFLLSADQAYLSIPSTMHDALEASTSDGRGGLGVIHAIAAGNHADDNDPDLDARTDYDELISSRFAISVGGVRLEAGVLDRYGASRRGASLVCSAPACDMWMTKQQVDTQTCEEIASYGCQPGTSFAAPCVAGVVALMLEANPGLSWRDVQEAIVRTAATIDDDPNDPDDWQTNTAGLDHSYEYGHGLVDAYEAVSFVTGTNGYPAWTPLAAESVMTLDVAPKGVQVGPGQTRTILLQGDGGLRVEHVELTMDVTATGAPGIGPLEIEVERLQLQQGDSPQPQVTRSVFAVARDDTSPSYDDGVFTSVRHWGEQSNATWKVRLRNTSTAQNPVTATWNNAELRLYGTE